MADTLPKKPSVWNEPRAWARRKLKLKLNDALDRYSMRVADRVGFGSLRSTADYRHIIDVGVADGTPDLYARFPDARLELFEPSPNHHLNLSAGILAQRPGHLHPVALGSQQGTSDLFLTGRTGSNLLGPTRKSASQVQTVRVDVRRLDDILMVEDLHKPCLLKIDTEGYELEVLRGATQLLQHLQTIVVEMHFNKPSSYFPYQIVNMLHDSGFQLVDMLDHHVAYNRVVCADFVFERL